MAATIDIKAVQAFETARVEPEEPVIPAAQFQQNFEAKQREIAKYLNPEAPVIELDPDPKKPEENDSGLSLRERLMKKSEIVKEQLDLYRNRLVEEHKKVEKCRQKKAEPRRSK